MPSVDRIIWNKLGIHRFDTLPFNGAPWNMKTTRVTLAEIFAEAEYKVGAEIGVERGHYSRLLCSIIPGVKMFCIDPWQPYAHQSEAREEGIYQKALQTLAGLNVEIIRKTSLEASKDIADNALDFVYIDGLHEFDPVMMDIILWSPKVRKGGIVSGHDYVPYFQYGVIQAVQAYTQVHNIENWYITIGEREPSWLWVKR
jgi:hypothetical protein